MYFIFSPLEKNLIHILVICAYYISPATSLATIYAAYYLNIPKCYIYIYYVLWSSYSPPQEIQ